MAQTVSEAQGSYPTLYVDGKTLDTAESAERVQVEWTAVSNGYVSDGYRCPECGEFFETATEAVEHGQEEHGTEEITFEHSAPLVNSAAIDWSGQTYDGVTVS